MRPPSIGSASTIESRLTAELLIPLSTESKYDAANALANASNISFGVAGAGTILAIVGIALSDFSSDESATLVP